MTLQANPHPPHPIYFLLAASALAMVGWTFARFEHMGRVEQPPRQLSFAPTDSDFSRMRALEGSLDRDAAEFPAEDAHQKENGRLFSYLAYSSGDPVVVEAALKAISTSYGAPSTKKQPSDEDLERILITFVDGPNPRLSRLAFDASRIPLTADEPSPEVIGVMLELMNPNKSPPLRLQAVEALDSVRPDLRSEKFVDAFLECQDDTHPVLVARCTLALGRTGPIVQKLPDESKGRVRGSIERLIDHTDPGVRARALEALSVLQLGSFEEFGKTTLALLDDSNPYVRATAIDIAMRARLDVPISVLVEYASDMRSTEYVLSGVRKVDGSPFELRGSVPGRPRVADAALLALQAQVRDREDVPPLRLSLGGPRRTEEDVRRAAATAREWYQGVGPSAESKQ